MGRDAAQQALDARQLAHNPRTLLCRGAHALLARAPRLPGSEHPTTSGRLAALPWPGDASKLLSPALAAAGAVSRGRARVRARARGVGRARLATLPVHARRAGHVAVEGSGGHRLPPRAH